MKRKIFLKEINDAGCYLKRHGSKHDIYFNPETGKKSPIPRHQEIKDTFDLRSRGMKSRSFSWGCSTSTARWRYSEQVFKILEEKEKRIAKAYR